MCSWATPGQHPGVIDGRFIAQHLVRVGSRWPIERRTVQSLPVRDVDRKCSTDMSEHSSKDTPRQPLTQQARGHTPAAVDNGWKRQPASKSCRATGANRKGTQAEPLDVVTAYGLPARSCNTESAPNQGSAVLAELREGWGAGGVLSRHPPRVSTAPGRKGPPLAIEAVEAGGDQRNA